MCNAHMSLKERESKRIIILIHNGLTLVLNDLKEEDYPLVFTSVSPVFIENIVVDYYRYLEHFKMVYSDMPERKLTIFDKALCLAMSMEQHSVISVSKGKGKTPARLTDLKEKIIANTVVDFLHASKYCIKDCLDCRIFDLRIFDDGHKRELKQLKSLLANEFKTVNFDYNSCLAILMKLYTKGVIYQNGFEDGLEPKIIENLRIKDNVDAYGVHVDVNVAYQEHKKRFRQ